MLNFIAENSNGLKYYFSKNRFIDFLSKKGKIEIIPLSGLYKIFKFRNIYIFPYSYDVYSVYYIISDNCELIKTWYFENCL